MRLFCWRETLYPAIAAVALALTIVVRGSSTFAAPAAAPPPAQIAPSAAPAPLGAPAAVVPMRIIGGKACVQVMIDGKGPFVLAIDTGAETMVISPAVAETCGLALKTGNVVVRGTTGGYVHVAQAQVAKITIGGTVAIDHPFTTVDPTLSRDGYIGAPLLNFYVAQLDFPARQASFWTPDRFRPNPADISMPLIIGVHRVPVVGGMLDGLHCRFELDTGSAFPLEVLPLFARTRALRTRLSPLGVTAQRSISGVAAADVFDAGSISLGVGRSVDYGGPLPALMINPIAAARSNEIDARVGLPILSASVLTIDYPHAKVYFRPLPPAAPAP